MKSSKILAIALMIIGAMLLLFSDYISTRVAEGKLQISNAQKKIDTVDTIFSKSKYTKSAGKLFTGSSQSKIDAGQLKVERYKNLSEIIKIIGIVSLVSGAGLLFLFLRRKR